MTSSEDMNSLAFKVISSFINSLSEVFGQDDMGVLLYNHLLSKTTKEHVVSIEKNVLLFRDFCVTNRDAIADRNIDAFKVEMIEYSEKVKFNIKDIFGLADEHTTKIIWTHLLTISAVVDPTGKAKSILKAKHDTSEGDFISGFLDKVEKNVDVNASPMEAINRMMSSGLLGNLIGDIGNGVSDGSLDMEKLMGSAQDIVTNLTGKDIDFKKMMNDAEGGAQPDISKIMGDILGSDSSEFGEISKMIGGLMSGGDGGAPPDLAKMMSGLMSGGDGGAPPDLAKMMSGLMSGGDGGAPPDLAKIMGELSSQDVDNTVSKSESPNP
jgi:hypothetical protein